MTDDTDEPTPPPLRRRDFWQEAIDLAIEEAERRPLNHEDQKRLEDSE